MSKIPDHYRQFRSKNRNFVHIENGWCARQVRGKWRVFYGLLRPGQEYPTYVTTYQEADSYLDFIEFAELEQWVLARRSL
jgi:hypothetical protein